MRGTENDYVAADRDKISFYSAESMCNITARIQSTEKYSHVRDVNGVETRSSDMSLVKREERVTRGFIFLTIVNSRRHP